MKTRISLLFAAALLTCSFFEPAHASDAVLSFTTLAGTAGSTVKSADGSGSDAQFNLPHGMASDAQGNIYVADSFNHTIRKITPEGVVSTLAGGAGEAGYADGTGTAARFNEPWGVTVDHTGNVFVADTNNNAIRMITPAGVVTTLAGSGGRQGSSDGVGSAAGFREPHGIGIDSNGNLYVADFGNNTVRKVTSAGVVTTLAGHVGSEGGTDGTGTAALFKGLQFLAVDANDNIYVTEAANKVVRKITTSGVVTTLTTGTPPPFGEPRGVVADSAGNLYVADSMDSVIRKVTSSGVVSVFAGISRTPGSDDGTTTTARFNAPFGVGLDVQGRLYVADTENNTIRVIANGTVTTFAGLAGRTSSVDGTGADARFEDPYALAVDGSGNIFVADATDHSIRKITLERVATTFAGRGGSFGSADGTGDEARFKGPLGIAADGAGNVYVADTGNYTIRKISPSGVVTTLAGSAGQPGGADGNGTTARFSNPYGVAVDTSGNLYVVESSGVVRKITSAGVVSTLAGGGGSGFVDGSGSAAKFSQPFDITIDGAGNVYVSDHGNHAVRKITSAGVVTTLAGSGTAGSSTGTGTAANFKFPSGIAADLTGNVYLADTDNQVIRKITPEGIVTTYAGTGAIGSTDGTASSFYNPKDVAFDASGNIYVADRGNHTIRKGTLSTATTAIQSDCLFGWAEVNYPSLFSPAAQSAEIDLGPFHYRYRYYSASAFYLATSSDGNVYYLGPADAAPVNVGLQSYWLGQAGCQ